MDTFTKDVELGKVAARKKRGRWIHAVSTDVPKNRLQYQRRYCALCKSRMDFRDDMDAWLCRNIKCNGILKLGYGIGPAKGDQEELVTITDPYSDLQKPFVKAIPTMSRNKHESGLPLIRKERIAKSAAEALRQW